MTFKKKGRLATNVNDGASDMKGNVFEIVATREIERAQNANFSRQYTSLWPQNSAYKTLICGFMIIPIKKVFALKHFRYNF